MAASRGVGCAALVLVALSGRAAAVHACDSEQGAACPAESGAGLGACLKDPSKHETKTEISDGCKSFIQINDACASDIESKCSGAGAYNDDTMVCLTQWTQEADLSAECVAALPKKEVKEEVVDKE